MKKHLQKLLSFNSSRFRLWQENAAFAATIPPGALVLDAGAGEGPYKSLFQHAKYESTDIEKVDKKYAPSTYTCDLKEIPVEDGRYAFVIFNQVLEHVPDPALVLNELHRVLKPGGKLIYSGPLFYEEHEQPYDFYRYTQFGLRHLFNASGFKIDRIDWLEGYFGTLGYQLNGMAYNLPLRPKELGSGFIGYLLAPMMFLLKAMAAILSILFHRMEKRFKFTARGYPKNYVAIVSRPASESNNPL